MHLVINSNRAKSRRTIIKFHHRYFIWNSILCDPSSAKHEHHNLISAQSRKVIFPSCCIHSSLENWELDLLTHNAFFSMFADQGELKHINRFLHGYWNWNTLHSHCKIVLSPIRASVPMPPGTTTMSGFGTCAHRWIPSPSVSSSSATEFFSCKHFSRYRFLTLYQSCEKFFNKKYMQNSSSTMSENFNFFKWDIPADISLKVWNTT